MTTIIIVVVVALVFFVTLCVVTFMVWKREEEMRTDSLRSIESDLQELGYRMTGDFSRGRRGRYLSSYGEDYEPIPAASSVRNRSADPFEWTRHGEPVQAVAAEASAQADGMQSVPDAGQNVRVATDTGASHAAEEAPAQGQMGAVQTETDTRSEAEQMSVAAAATGAPPGTAGKMDYEVDERQTADAGAPDTHSMDGGKAETAADADALEGMTSGNGEAWAGTENADNGYTDTMDLLRQVAAMPEQEFEPVGESDDGAGEQVENIQDIYDLFDEDDLDDDDFRSIDDTYENYYYPEIDLGGVLGEDEGGDDIIDMDDINVDDIDGYVADYVADDMSVEREPVGYDVGRSGRRYTAEELDMLIN